MASQDLIKPLRSLRTACRDTKRSRPELITWDCASCIHAPLCATSEQIKCGRFGRVINLEAKLPRPR